MFSVLEGLVPAQTTDEGTPGVCHAFGFRRFAGGKCHEALSAFLHINRQ
jgi:hypothetical protein